MPHSARSHASNLSGGGGGAPRPALRKKIKEHTGETPPATPKTWGLVSRGNPYLAGLEDDEDDDMYIMDPGMEIGSRHQAGGGMSTHRVTVEEMAEVKGVMGSVRRSLHAARQQQRDMVAAKKAEMVSERQRGAEEGKMVMARAREGKRVVDEKEGRTKVIRHQVRNDSHRKTFADFLIPGNQGRFVTRQRICIHVRTFTEIWQE